jgi:hypothetical protein
MRQRGIQMKLRVFGLVVLATAVSLGRGWAQEIRPPESLAVVNGLLEGKIAIVKLSDGKMIKKAKKVEIGVEWTQWSTRRKESRVPTADVVRVSLRGGRKILRGAGYGALSVAFGLSTVGASSDDSGWFSGTEGVFSLGAAGAVLGAVLGAATGTLSHREGLEVYEGPLDQFLAKHSQDESSLRDSSAPPWPGTASPFSFHLGEDERSWVELPIQSPLRRSAGV